MMNQQSSKKSDPDFLSLCPQRVGGIEEHGLLDEMVLYLSEKEVVLSLNHSARTVWEFCDNQRSIYEIGREIEAQYGDLAPENFDDLLSDVWTAVKKLTNYGFLKLVDDAGQDIQIID
jgi:hypothetical protein